MGAVCAAMFLAAGGAPGGSTVVEEVVAVVRNPAGAPPRVITLTRLTEEARIVLVSRGAVEAAFQPLDARALSATLSWLLDQILLSDEASRLGVGEVPRDQAAAELRRFQGRFAERGAWSRFLASTALTEEEVTAVLVRTRRAERYLESRLGRGGSVDDAEVEAFARANGMAVESRAARDAVRARVAELRTEGSVRALLAELRARADIRVLDPELARPEEP
ncbi:MAG TPA: hypothetical protein VEB43_17565 [Anaeromyxobacter sp.]|nr:hypothetical protein [Anaeromyxobacter sp.]